MGRARDNPDESPETTVAATLEAIAWKEAFLLRIYGVRVGIRVNQAGFFERLAHHFPPTWQLLVEAKGSAALSGSPHTRSPVVDRLYSLLTGGGDPCEGEPFHQVFEALEPGLRSGDLDTVLQDFERRLKIYVAEMAPRRVFVHAGAVGWRGRAIIIPGLTCTGKTTLVRELILAGATYFSDEYAVLDERGRVHPYPQPLGVRQPGSLQQVRRPLAALGGVEAVRPLPVGLVVVSPYKEGARWRPRVLSHGRAVLELLANTVPARRRPDVVVPTLGNAVADAVTLKGARGEAAEVARLILSRSEQAHP